MDKKPPKPTADELTAALKAMVAEADAAGQRDLPHVTAARELVARCEPELEPEHVETRAEERARVKAEKD